MSLIFRSLQQLQQRQLQKNEEKRSQKLRAVSRSLRPVLMRGILFVLLIALVVTATLMLLNLRVTGSLQGIESPASLQKRIQSMEQERAREEMLDEQEMEEQEGLNEKEIREQPATRPRMTNQPIIPKRTLNQELAEPTQQLESHFSRQANRNQSILDTEQALTDSLRKENTQSALWHLRRLEEQLGSGSKTVLRWKGVLALKQQNYERAESIFYRLVVGDPGDAKSRINLAIALAGQGKIEQAGKEVNIVLQHSPTNERAKKLKQVLGEK